jgi:hypothetical protein
MKVLITGGRTYSDDAMVYNALCYLPKGTIVIHGGARGADTLAGDAARELGFEVWEYPAQWDKYGKSAGLIRNRQMLDLKPDLVIAFHEDLEESKGTWDCMSEAMDRDIPVIYIN